MCILQERAVAEEVTELMEEVETGLADAQVDDDATVEENILILPSLKDHQQGKMGAVFQGTEDLLIHDEDPSLTVAEAC